MKVGSVDSIKTPAHVVLATDRPTIVVLVLLGEA